MLESLIAVGFLTFVRVSAFVAFLPLFGSRSVPKSVKIGLAVALTVVWSCQAWSQAFLVIQHFGGNRWFVFTWLICREALLGAGLGYFLSLALVPIRIAGSYIAQEMGLTIATLTTSDSAGSQSVLAELFEGIAILAMLSLNIHHLFFIVFDRLFELAPLAGEWKIPSLLWLSQRVGHLTMNGIQLTLPVALCLMLTALGILFIMRQVPQFNLLTFGMPIRLLAGLLAIVIFIPDITWNAAVMIQRWCALLPII